MKSTQYLNTATYCLVAASLAVLIAVALVHVPDMGRMPSLAMEARHG